MGWAVTWGTVWGGSAAGAGEGGPETLSNFGPFFAAVARGNAGRVEPQNWTPTNLAHAMVLGSDVPGHFGKFNDGDHFDVSQQVDFNTGLIVRCLARIRGPTTVPSGASWHAKLLLNGTEFATREIEVGRTRDLSDMGANLTHLTSGVHTLTFRLAFQGSPTGGPYTAEMPAFYLDSVSVDEPPP